MPVLLRGIAALVVILIFMLTLTLNWPLAGLTGLLWQEENRPRLAGVGGTLTDATAERLVLEVQGWPLALGPIAWQIGWPPGIHLQLGHTPGDWQIDGTWQGLKSRWKVRGGDLSALDLSRLPIDLAARWEGVLNVTVEGNRCVASEGVLTAARIALRSPTAIELGRGRLQLDCTGPTPQLRLDIEDGQALSLTAELSLSISSGSGRIEGRIAASHPLAEWRRLVQPGAQGEQIDEHFRW